MVATPIGNLGDLTRRAQEALRQADLIAAEDTRTARKLLAVLGIRGKELVSYFEGNQTRMDERLLGALQEGKRVSLISESGMPCISDPGYTLIRGAIEKQIPWSVIPGPSAVTTALVLSGLPVDRFSFEGFLPRSRGERLRRLESVRSDERTLIFFVSPHKLSETLREFGEVLGARHAALVREMTKLHEQVVQGTIDKLQELVARQDLRGEMVLVVEGLRATQPSTLPERATVQEALEKLLEKGLSRREAVRQLALEHAWPRKLVYRISLEMNRESSHA